MSAELCQLCIHIEHMGVSFFEGTLVWLVLKGNQTETNRFLSPSMKRPTNINKSARKGAAAALPHFRNGDHCQCKPHEALRLPRPIQTLANTSGNALCRFPVSSSFVQKAQSTLFQTIYVICHSVGGHVIFRSSRTHDCSQIGEPLIHTTPCAAKAVTHDLT